MQVMNRDNSRPGDNSRLRDMSMGTRRFADSGVRDNVPWPVGHEFQGITDF